MNGLLGNNHLISAGLKIPVLNKCDIMNYDYEPRMQTCS